MRWAWLLLMVCAGGSGCIGEKSINCDDGSLCPGNLVCAPQGGCATADQLSACIDKNDGELCTLGIGDGECRDQVCVLSRCGNAAVDSGEVCDDGNDVSGDGCRSDCQKIEICGDGEPDTGELCDDGNTNSVDECDACRITQWTARAIAGGSSQAIAESLSDPGAVFVDNHGDIFITDTGHHRVVRVDGLTGSVTTIAGTGVAGYSGDGAAATSAHLDSPHGIFVDGLGNVLIADTFNHRIRRVDAKNGKISTLAGTGAPGFNGDEIPATGAQLFNPQAVVADGFGNVYVCDFNNQRIRRVDAQTGIITTVAGTGTSGFSGDGFPAASAQLNYPAGLALDADGNLLIADMQNKRIRRVNADTGIIETVAGTDNPVPGENPLATEVLLDSPRSVTVDPGGNFFILEGDRIQRVDGQNGTILAVASNVSWLFAAGLFADSAGRVLVADAGNSRIERIDFEGPLALAVETVAGNGRPDTFGDGGFASSAPLGVPSGLAFDSSGNLFFADSRQRRIRRIDAQTGVITTIAGTGLAAFSGDGGLATDAGLGSPRAITLDALDNLYIADTTHRRIRRVDAVTGIITTVASALIYPVAVAVDPNGNLVIVDSGVHKVLRLDPNGDLSTLAGDGTQGFAGDGDAATNAALNSPQALAIDSEGNVFIADTHNYRIRRVDAVTGIIETIAGTDFPGNGGDGGPAIAATLSYPRSLFLDGDNLLIADGDRVRRVDENGDIWLVAGSGPAGTGDGGPAISTGFAGAASVVADADDNLYIADSDGSGDGSGIRRVDGISGVIVTIAGAVFPAGMGLLPQARLADPQAMCVAGSNLFIAGGSAGVVMELRKEPSSLHSVVGRYPQLSPPSNLARYRNSQFGDVGGVAYDAAEQKMYLSESSHHRIQVVDLVDRDDADSWTIAPLANLAGAAGFADGPTQTALFRQPMGLFFDEATRTLFVADTGNHVVRAIDVDSDTVMTVAGTPEQLGTFGDGGDALSALLYQPSAVTKCPNGDLFIAEIAGHRIRRVAAMTQFIDTVLGDGTPASSGEGAPASAFPVDSPRGLACDALGNLYVTSRTVVRVLPADASGVVDGTGALYTIYGESPRDSFPASVTKCLTGIAVTGPNTVQLADSCTGMVIELTRETL